MVNTILQQPTYASLLTTDYLLTWQGSEAPSTRKTPVSALGTYYAPLAGATVTGTYTFQNGINVSGGLATFGVAATFQNGLNVTSGTTVIQAAAAASTQALRADQAWQTIATYSPSNVGAQAFPLSSLFRRFRLTLQGAMVLTNGTELGIQFSTDGGGSYLNTSYAWCLTRSLTDLTGGFFGSLSSNQIIFVEPSIVNIPGIDAVIEIYPGSATTRATASGSNIMYGDFASGGQLANASVTGQLTVVGNVNFARIFATNGNFSGTVILEGLP